ncbi:uncharacterized protein LOC110108779 [Dendrobium catenatum]|uniref:uncharacterized protein LOC110108779 n=1 Tax=Dendrobium catenatum TaxID=906689 RepID=UPI0009F52640|nr:uncharacterized protein LOC110108779 [Dendrobium catenatum]
MNLEGLRLAPLATVKHLIRLASDHYPLLLCLAPTLHKPEGRWLRFEDIWMTYLVTWKIVWKNWTKQDYGQLADVLNRKCHRTLRALFFWSRNWLKELGELKNSLEAHMEELWVIESSARVLTEEQEQEMRRKAVELKSTLALIATWWRQRAKTRWIEEGDANSHFFHATASARRCGNRIGEVLNSNGECVAEPKAIQYEFMNFFMSKWRDRQVCMDHWLDFQSNDKVPKFMIGGLEAAITEQEIQKAVFSMGKNRASGVDDDILVFAEACRGSANQIMNILNDYCSWTGQKINSGKSAILFNRRCQSWKKRIISKLMEFRKVNSLEYLGLPLVMRKLVVDDFAKVLKTAHEKTNLWGKKHLSMAGRAPFIRTSLLTIPMYLMTHTAVPLGVLSKVERMCRRFLWRKDVNSRGMNYVAWNELCQPREQGGLGFHCLALWQSSLRARLAWEVLQNDNSLLKKVVLPKYVANIWCYKKGRNVSISWKVILDGAAALRSHSQMENWRWPPGGCAE